METKYVIELRARREVRESQQHYVQEQRRAQQGRGVTLVQQHTR